MGVSDRSNVDAYLEVPTTKLHSYLGSLTQSGSDSLGAGPAAAMPKHHMLRCASHQGV
jgi:hypothetical protein